MAHEGNVKSGAPPKKRKAEVENAPSKKRKAGDDGAPKKKRKRQVREDDADLDAEAGLNRSFERMDSQLIADHIAQKTTRHGTDLSPVELADLYVSANHIKDTTSWEKPRSLENLPEFLEAFSEDPKKLEVAPRKNGSPHTLVVAGAGLRAADLVRSLRKFQKKGNTVGKLFAKHFKVEEQVSFLQKSKTGISVGTPQRLSDLIENGALNLDNLKRIVVDASYIDQKKRNIMDMRETMMPLVHLLTKRELKERYSAEEKPVELIFY
ncbi:U3-containing 90S pre-ribosomal complex subunit-domain containing protein [Immersiella caudata]|uniref:U3-containing 90S pre-ribosomal complex subunit-domain containing protein n=1 Tax=Immersiella caudata TaxID=314043 RepID=A0AA40CDP3_9PEZI|nr:U3-containing 90S pre-ribosomal complex subunit-domain containing protein [Immersiella caudata]